MVPAEQSEIAELRNRIDSLETMLASYVQEANRTNSPYQRIFLAKRDATTPAKWKEWTVNNGAVAEFTAGRECTNEEGPAALIDPAEEADGEDFAFLMEVRDYDGANQVTRFVKMGGGGEGTLIPVTVTQTGGVAGNLTTQCTFTYTVTGLDAVELGTAVAPLMQRPALGKTTAAVRGLGYYDDTDVFKLLWCDEVPTRLGC